MLGVRCVKMCPFTNQDLFLVFMSNWDLHTEELHIKDTNVLRSHAWTTIPDGQSLCTHPVTYGCRINKCHTSSIKVTDSVAPKTQILKHLRGHLDESLNFKKHIVENCRIAEWTFILLNKYFVIWQVMQSTQLVQSLTVSHLDYGGSHILM